MISSVRPKVPSLKLRPGAGSQDSIPKSLAEIFLDMCGAMTRCAEMYDSDVQSKIHASADHLTQHARDICSS